MKNSIRLHPKYGLNPTMVSCIICGGDTGGIALLGNFLKEEAPMHMVLTPEPCDACRKKYLTEGFLLVGIDRSNNILLGAAVIKNESWGGMFKIPMPERKIALLDKETWEKVTQQ